MKLKKQYMLFIMLAVAVAVTVCGIVFKQAVWRMIPLYVSLVIALLQSRVNRFAPLLGGANALLYTAVYFSYALYGQALYALLVSCPLQIVTFVRWQKRKSGNSTVLRKMPNIMKILVSVACVGIWILLAFFRKNSDSAYYLLDNTVTLFGILATIVMMLSFIEYTVLMVINGCCTIWLYISMLETNPEQFTYLVFAIYSLLCTVLAMFTAYRALKAREAGSKNIAKDGEL